VCDKERRENFTFLSWFTSCLSYVLGAAIIEWSVYLESISGGIMSQEDGEPFKKVEKRLLLQQHLNLRKRNMTMKAV
jgi:hypothetical protein